jgi:hypothetical protein
MSQPGDSVPFGTPARRKKVSYPMKTELRFGSSGFGDIFGEFYELLLVENKQVVYR